MICRNGNGYGCHSEKKKDTFINYFDAIIDSLYKSDFLLIPLSISGQISALEKVCLHRFTMSLWLFHSCSVECLLNITYTGSNKSLASFLKNTYLGKQT